MTDGCIRNRWEFGMDLEWILGEMTGEHGEWSGMDLEWISNGFGMDFWGNEWGL